MPFSVIAQTETDTTFASQVNYIFANVEKNRVPYGILRDYPTVGAMQGRLRVLAYLCFSRTMKHKLY